MNANVSPTLKDYWNRLRGARPAPLRHDINPAEISDLLPDTFILRQDQHGRAQFRLAGTRLCASYGRELRHVPLASLWHPSHSSAIDETFAFVFGRSAPARLQFQGQSRSGRFCPFELIALPLHETDGIHGALGLIRPLAAPFWLGADPIISNFPLQNDDSADVSDNAIVNENDQNDLDTTPSAPRRIRHLLVINGGKS